MNEPFSIIIPDRNDREEFTAHCYEQIRLQTVHPAQIIHVNYPPQKRTFDLSERLQYGLKRAETDLVFFFENDDYYPDDYFERMLPMMSGADIGGIDRTIYYNIRTLNYKELKHFDPPRSSLAFTVIRKSRFAKFAWPDNSNPLIDMALWEYARKHLRLRITLDTYPVSIKHGVGLCGVKWHYRDFKDGVKDHKMTWLREHTRKESFDFYQEWHTRNR